MDKKEDNLNEIAEIFMKLLDTLTYLAQKELKDELNDFDNNLSSERVLVLYRLFARPEQNLKELANSLKLTSSSMSSMISNLVEKNLVERKRDPEDRRKIVLSLTNGGKKVVKKTRKMYLKKIRKWLEQVDEKEYDLLFESSKTIVEIITKNMSF